jgi:hypothetical protein
MTWTQTFSSVGSAIEEIRKVYWDNLQMYENDPTKMWEDAVRNIKTKKDTTFLTVKQLDEPRSDSNDEDDEDDEDERVPLYALITQLKPPTS